MACSKYYEKRKQISFCDIEPLHPMSALPNNEAETSLNSYGYKIIEVNMT